MLERPGLHFTLYERFVVESSFACIFLYMLWPKKGYNRIFVFFLFYRNLIQVMLLDLMLINRLLII